MTHTHSVMAVRDRGRLLIACQDQPGIVAAVSQFLFEHGANIVHSDQHTTDPTGGRFFMRVEFDLSGLDASTVLASEFQTVATRFGMDWRLSLASRLKRLAIFVSREAHCLLELLWRHRAGDIQADVVLVLSNHELLASEAAASGIPFRHVPVTLDRKTQAEQEQLRLLEEYGVDTI